MTLLVVFSLCLAAISADITRLEGGRETLAKRPRLRDAMSILSFSDSRNRHKEHQRTHVKTCCQRDFEEHLAQSPRAFRKHHGVDVAVGADGMQLPRRAVLPRLPKWDRATQSCRRLESVGRSI